MLQFLLMRLLYSTIFLAFLLFFQTAFTVFATSADCNLGVTLKLGTRGAEVECLQAKLGVKIDGKFGPMTKIAVVAFQSSNGLRADGIIGSITRAFLASTPANQGIYPTGCVSALGYSPKTGIKCDTGSNAEILNSLSDGAGSISVQNNKQSESATKNSNITEKINPNLVNLDQFIETVINVNEKKGSSEEELKLIADNLRKIATNSDMDFNKEFEKMLIKESKLGNDLKIQSSFSFVDKIVGKTLSFLGITPSVAEAATGTPFGGRLIYSFFCAYNDTWMITITPLPPTYVVLLSYIPGTQAFASYNIPFTSNLLGTYTPPGVCIIPAGPYPITIPTEGYIGPMTGSSPS